MNDSTPVRRWVPIQHLLDAIEERREHITLPAAPQPVTPASDDECYALNRPKDCQKAMKEAGLPGLARPSYSRKPKK